MAKRCSKRRGAKMHRRTRRGGSIYHGQGGIAGDGFRVGSGSKVGGGRKKITRTRRRTRRGGDTHVTGIRASF
jgi:hypothetical protein